MAPNSSDRESQYLFQTIEYFYMERITLVEASLLQSKNDGFHETSNMSFYKKTPCLEIKETPGQK